jgi:GT2 family glycosyltransferase
VERIVKWAEQHRWHNRIVNYHDGVVPAADEDVRLLVVRSDRNRGFTGGNNVALRYGMASARGYRYAWVLNTDTTVEPDALAELVRAMEVRPDAASAQSLLVWAREPRLLDSAGMRLLRRGGSIDVLRRRPRTELSSVTNGQDVVPIFGSCAASALYRVSVLREHGVFDELFHTGYEDVDLACRFQAHGLEAVLAARSVVFHVGGASRNKRKKGLPWWTGHRNKLWMVARWYPFVLALPILLVGFVRAFIASLRTAGVSLGEWQRLVAVALRELRNGTSNSTRRRIVKMGGAGRIS